MKIEDQAARQLADSLHGDPKNPWKTGSEEWIEFSRLFRDEYYFYPQDGSDMNCWKWFKAGYDARTNK